MAAGLSPINKSRATVQYTYAVTGLTASTANAIVLTGVAPNDFIPDPQNTKVTPLGGAALATASFSQASLVIDPDDSTQVKITVYTGADTTSVLIELVGGGNPAA